MANTEPPCEAASPVVAIIMGVAGSGKTTVGSMLARRLGWQYWDGDDFHPEQNIRKMRSGIALSDDDRLPWLLYLRAIIEQSLCRGESGVLACSALKESYRHILADGLSGVRFVYLRGSRELLATRLEERHGHFMRPQLLDSQLATLEEPSGAVVADIRQGPEEIVEAIVKALRANPC